MTQARRNSSLLRKWNNHSRFICLVFMGLIIVFGALGQSRIPAQTDNFLQVTGDVANGDTDFYQVVFFEVPEDTPGPLYFGVYDPGLNDDQAVGDPDQGNTGVWTYSLYGGNGVITGSGAKNVTLSLAQATTGNLVPSVGTNTLTGTGPANETNTGEVSEDRWVYFDGVFPSDGEKIGNKYYFKVFATVDNGDKNAFQLDVSLSGTHGVDPTGVSGVRSFAYSWTLALLDRGVTNQWLLYPFLPDTATGNLTTHNWDFDGPTDADTLTLSSKSGAAQAVPAQSGNNVQAASNYDILTVEGVTLQSEVNGTWTYGITEDGVVGGDPGINTSTIWVTNSADTNWDLEATDVPYRIYASPYFPPEPNSVTIDPANDSTTKGSALTYTIQIVDSSGDPVPYVRDVYVSGSSDGTGTVSVNAGGANAVVSTDNDGIGSFTLELTGGTASETVTLTLTTDGTNGSDRLPATGTLGTNESATGLFNEANDDPPTLTMTALNFTQGTTGDLPALTYTETNDLATPNGTDADNLRIRIPSDLSAIFNTAQTPDITGTASAKVGSVSFESDTVLLLDLNADLVNDETIIIGAVTALQLTTPNSPSTGELELGYLGASGAYSVAASNSITIDPATSFTWDGGAATNNWGDAANWNPDGVPDGSVNVTISGAVTVLVNGAGYDVLNLSVASGSTLQLAGDDLAANGDLYLDGVLEVGGVGVLNGTAAFDTNSGTVRYTGAGTTGLAQGNEYFDLSFANGSGTYTLDAELTVNGDLTLEATGDLNGGAQQINLYGSWDNTAVGTFTSNSSTLVLLGSSTAQILGSTNSFANFQSQVPGKRIQFEAGQSHTITGNLTLQGSSTTDLFIESTVDTTQFTLNKAPVGTLSLSYLFVKDSAVLGNDLPAAYSTDGGNNSVPTPGWDFVAGNILQWTGATDNDWNTDTNWSPVAFPGGTDSIEIPAGGTPVLGGNFAVNNIVLFGGATLDLGGNTLTVNSEMTMDGAVSNGQLSVAATDLSGTYSSGGGDIEFNAPVTLVGDTTINTSGGDLTFTALATIDGGYDLVTNSGAGITEFGGVVGTTPITSLDATSSNQIRVLAALTADGNTLTFNGPYYTNTASPLTDSGTITFNNTVTVDNSVFTIVASEINFNGGADSVTTIGTSSLVLTENGGDDDVRLGAGVGAIGRLDITSTDLDAIDNSFNMLTISATTGIVSWEGTANLKSPTTISDDLTINSGDIVAQNSFNVTGTLLVNGSSNLGDSPGTGTLTLNAINLADGVTLGLGTGGNQDITTDLLSVNTTPGSPSVTINQGTGASNPVNIGGTIGAVNRLGVLTVTQSNGVNFTGTVDATNLVVSDTAAAQTVSFADNLAVTTASTFAAGTGAYNLSITGGTNSFGNAVIFSNTGTLALGAGGGTSTFNNGVTATSPTGITLAGTIATTGDAMALGAIALGNNTLLDTGDAAAGTINIGAVTGGGFNLSLDSGSTGGATITGTSVDHVGDLIVVDAGGLVGFSGTIGAGTPGAISITNTQAGITFSAAVDSTAITITDSAGAVTFSNTVGAGTPGTIGITDSQALVSFGNTVAATTITITDSQAGVSFSDTVNTTNLVVSDTAASQTVSFADNLAVTTASTFAAGTGAYNLSITGGTNSFGNAVIFSNTGTLALGAGGGTSTFNNGVTATAPTVITLAGTIATTGDAMALGAIALGNNTLLDTGDAAAGTINIGAVTGGGFNLSLDSGSTGGATITGTSVDQVANLTVVDAGGLVGFSGTIGAGTPGAISITNTQAGITFSAAVDSTAITITDSAGAVTFSNTVGAGTPGTIGITDSQALVSFGNTVAATTITISDSQAGVSFSDTVNTTNLVVSDTAASQTVSFADNLAVTTASTFAAGTGAYNLSITGGTNSFGNAVIFSNTGTLALGAGGGTSTFNNGVTATSPTGITLAGTIATTGDAMALGAIALGNNTLLDTGDAAAGTINIGSVTGGGFNLSLDSGSTGGATITGTSVDQVANLTVVDAGGLVGFSGTIGAGTPGAISITNTQAGITFSAAVDSTAITITDSAGAVTFSNTVGAGTPGTIGITDSQALVSFGNTVAATTITINDSQAGVSFSDTVNTTNLVVSDTAASQTVSFADSLAVTTASTFAAGTGAYNLSFTGMTNSFGNAVSFSNTGTLTLGGGGSFTFTNGITASTAPSSIDVSSDLTGSNSDMNLGDTDTTTTISANATISSGTGTLTLGTTSVADGITLTLVGDEIDLNDAVSPAVINTPILNLYPASGALDIRVGGAAPALGRLDITSAELLAIAANFASVNIGQITDTGAVTLDTFTYNSDLFVRANQSISFIGTPAGVADFSAQTDNNNAIQFGNGTGINITGTIDLLAGGDINTAGATDTVALVSGGNTITLTADNNGDNTGGVDFSDDFTVNSAGAQIILSAHQNLDVTGLTSTYSAGVAINLTSTAGAITDAGDNTVDITAVNPGGTVTLSAATGIGLLETQMLVVDASTSGTGDIQLSNSTGITVNQLQTNDGAISLITTTGNITLTDGSVNAGTNSATLDSAGTIYATANNGTAEITAGDLSLVANDLGGAIGAGGVTPEVTLAGAQTLSVDTAANDNDTTLELLSSVNLDQVDLGTGTFTITVVGTLGRDVGLTPDLTAATADITSSTGINLETSVTNLNAEVTGTGTITILESNGVSVNQIETNDGSLSLTTTAGNITLTDDSVNAGTNSATLDSAGTIYATANNGTAEITAGDLSLVANDLGGAIGAGGVIPEVTLAGTQTLSVDTAANDNDTTLELLSSVNLDQVDLGTGTFTITVVGTLGRDVGLTPDLTAATADITSSTGINLETSVTNLNAEVTGTGTITILESNGVSVNQIETNDGSLSLTTTAGNIILTDNSVDSGTNSATLDSAGTIYATANNGTAEITAGDLSLVANDLGGAIGAGGVIPEVTLAGAQTLSVDTAANDNDTTLELLSSVNLDQVDLGTGTFTLTVVGTLGRDVGSSPDLTAATADITSSTGINLETSVTNLNAEVTGTGTITIVESNGVSVNQIETNDGSLSLTTTAGNITLTDNSVDAGTNSATLDSAGTIYATANNGTAEITAGDLSLVADNPGGAIGDGGVIPEVTLAGAQTLSVDTAANNRNASLELLSDVNISELDLGGGALLLTVTGAINSDNVTRPDILAGSVDLDATAGIGHTNFIDLSGVGTMDIANSGGQNVEITSGTNNDVSITNLTTIGGNISYTHTGLGAGNEVTIDGTVSSGDAATVGGTIDIISNRDIIVALAGTVSSDDGSTGGTLILDAVTLNSAPILGSANITLDGDNTNAGLGDITLASLTFPDTTTITSRGDIAVTNSVQTTSGDFTLSAAEDIDISAALLTGAGGNLSLTADSNDDGSGGVRVQLAGSVNSAGTLDIAGSSFNGTGNLLVVAADGANTQVQSTGLLSIDPRGGAGSNADVLIQGVINASAALTINANRSILMTNAAADFTSVGAMTLTANSDATNDFGAITMSDGASLNAGASTITLSAREDITLGYLETSNATISAVTITSTAGSILDADLGAASDIVASAGGSRVTLSSPAFIGSTGAELVTAAVPNSALDTTIVDLSLAGNPTDTFINNTGTLTVTQAGSPSGTGAGNLMINNSAALNIAALSVGTGLGNDNVAFLSGGNITLPGAAGMDVNAGTIRIEVPDANDILDGDTNLTNYPFTAGTLVLRAGVAEILTTVVGTLDVQNLGTGANSDLNISQTGAVVVSALSTAEGDIDLTATGQIDSSGTAVAAGGNGDLTLTTTSGDILLGSLDASGNTVTLDSNGSILDDGAGAVDITADTLDADMGSAFGSAPEPIALANVDSLDILGTANGVIYASNAADAAVTVSGLQTGTAAIQYIQTGSQTLDVTSAVTTAGAIDLRNAGAQLTATTVNTGVGANIDLTTTVAGDVVIGTLSAGTGTVSINSFASILDDGAGAVDITANALDADMGSAFGTALQPIGLSGVDSLDISGTGAGTIYATNAADAAVTVTGLQTGAAIIQYIQSGGETLVVDSAVSTSGAIELENTGAQITATSVNTGVGANIDITNTGAGDMVIGTLSAGTGTVNLNSFGSILDDGAGLVDITADVLDADMGSAFGSAPEPIALANVDSLDILGTANGVIYASNDADAAVTVSGLQTGTAAIQYIQTGSQTLDVTSAVTTAGAIDLRNAGAQLTATTVNTGVGANIDLTTTVAGDVVIGTLSAGTGTVSINSFASILDDGAGAVDITADALDADMGSAFGTALQPIGLSGVDSLDISGTGAGAIYATNDADAAVTVTGLQTGAAIIQYIQSGGETLVVDSAVSTSGAIELENTGAQITATSVNTGVGANIDITNTGAGDMVIGTLSAGTGTVTLNSFGSILDDGAGLVDITADVLDADMGSAFGSAPEPIALANVDSLDILGTANGGIYASNAADAAVTVSGLQTGTAAIQYIQTGSQTLAITSAVTTAGSIDLRNAGAQLTATTVNTGVGANIDLTTTVAGDVVFGTLSAGTGTVSINSFASILDDGAGAVDITADALDADMGSAFGTVLQPIALSGVDSLDISGTGAGAIYATNAADAAVTVTGLVTGAARIQYIQSGAQTLLVNDAENVSGGIEIQSADTLTVDDVESTTSGDIDLTAVGNLTVQTTGVSAAGGGAINLVSDADLIINQALSTNNGAISLLADNDITLGLNGDISSGNGQISLTADAAAPVGGGITMSNDNTSDVSLVNAGSGRIILSATDNVVLGSLSTTNAGTGATPAVEISSSAGSVTEAAAFAVEIISNSGEAQINAASGIALSTTVDSLDSSLSAAGSINITESDGLVITLLQSFDGPISLTSTTGNIGTITVTAGDDGSNETHDLTLIATTGNIQVGDGAGGGQLTTITPGSQLILQAPAGSILDNNNDTNDEFTAGTIDFSSANAIGSVTAIAGVNPITSGNALEGAAQSVDQIATTAANSDVFVYLSSLANPATLSSDAISAGNGTTSGSELILWVASALDLGTNFALNVTDDDDVRIVSTGVLTLEDAGYSTTGDLYFQGDDVQDTTDRTLGPLISNLLDFTSNSGSATTLNTNVANLVADMTGASVALTINETNAILLTDVQTTNGLLDINSTSGDITTVQINSGTANTLINAGTGAILGTNGAATDIQALGVELIATGDIGNGSANPLEIDVTNLAGVSSSGSIYLQDSGVADALTVGTVVTNGLSVSAGAGVIELDALSTAGSLDINQPITTDTGNLRLRANNGILMGVDGDITSSSGSLTLESDLDLDGGVLTMDAGTTIDTGSGLISLTSTNAMSLGVLTTTSAASPAVTLFSRSGAIDEADNANVEITTPGRLSITSELGIGTTGAIDTEVAEMILVNDASGVIDISEADALTLISLDNDGNGANQIVSAGDGIITLAGNLDTIGGAITFPSRLELSNAVNITTAGGQLNFDRDLEGGNQDLTINVGAASVLIGDGANGNDFGLTGFGATTGLGVLDITANQIRFRTPASTVFSNGQNMSITGPILQDDGVNLTINNNSGAGTISLGDVTSTVGVADESFTLLGGTGDLTLSSLGDGTAQRITDVLVRHNGNFFIGVGETINVVGELQLYTLTGAADMRIGANGGTGFNFDDADFDRISGATALRIGESGVQSGVMTIRTLTLPAGIQDTPVFLSSDNGAGSIGLDDETTGTALGTAGSANISIRTGTGSLSSSTRDTNPEISTSGTVSLYSENTLGNPALPIQFPGGQTGITVLRAPGGAYLEGIAGNITLETVDTQGGTLVLSIFTPGAGDVIVLNQDITANGQDIVFASPVRLAADILISTGAGGGSLSFQNTLDGTTTGADDLSIQLGTGDLSFDLTGDTTRLGIITVNDANDVDLTNDFTAASLVQVTGAGTTSFDGSLDLNPGNLDLNADTITLNFPGLIDGGDVILTPATLLSLVDNTSSADTATWDWEVSGTFTQVGNVPVSLSADIRTQGGNTQFQGPVTLIGNTAITTNNTIPAGANLEFSRTLDGQVTNDWDLIFNTGTAGALDFLGAVGATDEPGNLTADSGPVNFANQMSLSGALDLDSTTVDFNGPVNLGSTALISNSGLLTQAVGATLSVPGGFTQDATGSLSLSDDITTSTTAIDILGDVVIAASLTMSTSTGAGDITLRAAVDGPAALTINTDTGVLEFLSDVGLGTALGALDLTASRFNGYGGALLTSGVLDASAVPQTHVQLGNDGTWGAGTGAMLFDELYVDSLLGRTLTLSSDLSVTEIYFTRGNWNPGGQSITTSGDLVLLGASRDERDLDRDAGVNSYYEYTNMSAIDTFLGAITTSGAFTDLAASQWTVGGNFFSNGIDLTGTSNWNLAVQDVSAQSPLLNPPFGTIYNQAFNGQVQNSQVTGGVIAAASTVGGETNHAMVDNGGNTLSNLASTYGPGWDFERVSITSVATVYDDVIEIIFSEPVLNTNNELDEVVGSATADDNFRLNGGGISFTGVFTDAQATTPTTGQGNLDTIYLQVSGTTWNTDANGTSAGAALSTNRDGDAQTIIPDLSIFKNRVFDAQGKNALPNYGENGFAIFDATTDRTRPVLVEVLAGRAAHDADPTNYTAYDAHNYFRLRYSEPVNLDDGEATLQIGGLATNLRADADIATGHGGDLVSSAGVASVAGFFSYPGTISRGATDGDPVSNSLFRTTTENPSGDHGVTLYVVGFSTGTGAATDWPGYIFDVTDPVGQTLTVGNNSGLTDALGNAVEPTSDPYAKASQSIVIEGTGWDIDPPVIAPFTEAGDLTIREIVTVDTNFSGLVDKIEFHFLDDSALLTTWDSATDHTDLNSGIRDNTLDNLLSFSFSLEGLEPFTGLFNSSFGSDVTNNLFSNFTVAFDTQDDNYLSINLTDSGYNWLQTSQLNLSYDESLGRVTDLAGNLLRSIPEGSSLASIERTPPRIALTLTGVDKSQVYVEFSERVFSADRTTGLQSDDFIFQGGNTILAVDNQTTTPSNGINSVLLTLQNPVEPDDLFSHRISVEANSVFDLPGNVMSNLVQYPITELAIDLVTPLWASDGFGGEENQSGTARVVRDFTGTEDVTDQDVDLQVQVQGTTGPQENISLIYDVNVASGALFGDGLWLPEQIDGVNTSPNLEARFLDPYASNLDLFNFLIPSTDLEFAYGNTIEFMFKVGGLLAVPSTSTTDPTAFGIYSFGVRDIVRQKGGVTVLNNVINPLQGEQAQVIYEMEDSGVATVQLFALDGSLVRILYRGRQAAGEYRLFWDGRNQSGDIVARGMYFLRVVAPGVDEMRNIMVVK